MKPVDVKPSKYIDFNKEDIKKGPKLKVGDHVRISKYKDIFYKKKLQKSNQKEKKHIKRKGNKPYIKWKVYNNSFNSWINKKEIV